MKKYILIISIVTILIVFTLVYLSDYIKNIYFQDSMEDFKDIYSIILKAFNKSSFESFENKKDELMAKYEERLKLRQSEIFKNSSGEPTMQELSFDAQSEKDKNGVYDIYSSINDPISDEYLPYTIKNYRDDPEAISTNNMNEFTIINIYKNALDRQPTEKELKKDLQDFYENEMNENLLKLRIYNSSEYKIITNMQSNDIKPDLITNISKWQLKDNLKKLYMDQFNTELTNNKLLDILVKCYIHLQFNEYLFKAMLMHDKYKGFEYKLKEEYILSDRKLLEIFNESFILHELRLIANELKRQDVLKRKALLIPVSLNRVEHSELNSSNIINMGSDKYISDIVKNSDNVFNINIMLNDNNNSTTPYVRTSSDSIANSGNAIGSVVGGNIGNIGNIGNSIGNSIGSGLGNGLNGNIANNIGNSIGSGLGYGLNGNIANNIGNSIGNGLNGNIANNIGNSIGSGLGNSIGSGLGGSIGSEIGGTIGTIGSGIGGGFGGTIGSGIGGSGIGGSGIGGSGIGGNGLGGNGLGGNGLGGNTGGSLSSISTSNLNLDTLTTKKYRDIYNELYNDINKEAQYSEIQYSNEDIVNDLRKSQKTSTRIYNPIDYKRHNRGGINSKPNVCLFDKTKIIQPDFSSSSPDFEGTDLKDAIENTQVGSIMPKFVYYEYEDISSS